jgi:hypothetical protein
MIENHKHFRDMGLGNVVSVGMYEEDGKEDLEKRIYVDQIILRLILLTLYFSFHYIENWFHLYK